MTDYDDTQDCEDPDYYEQGDDDIHEYSLEGYASSILKTFTGHIPNLGDVLSLKDDLFKLLTTKYNVSKGRIQ